MAPSLARAARRPCAAAARPASAAATARTRRPLTGFPLTQGVDVTDRSRRARGPFVDAPHGVAERRRARLGPQCALTPGEGVEASHEPERAATGFPPITAHRLRSAGGCESLSG